MPKLAQPGKSQQAGPVPMLSGPGAAGGATAGATPDMFGFKPGGSAPQASGGAVDLLDMVAPQPAAAPLDFFAEAPAQMATPMLPVSAPQNGGAANQDWNAFHSAGSPQGQQPMQQQQPFMNAFGGNGVAQPQSQQGMMGAQMGNFMGAQQQAPGWGGMAQAPMGMGGGAQGFPTQNMGAPQMGFGQNMNAPQAGYGAGFAPQAGMAPGMGGMPGGGMGGGMGGMVPGMAQGGMMQGMQGFQQGGGMGGMGGMPGNGMMATGMGGFQGGPAGRGGMMPGGAAAGMNPGASASAATGPSGNNVEDLLSKAMDGVANLSFEQRKGTGTSASLQSHVPMNMMQQQQQQPRGW